MMVIEIFADFCCPWSFIGRRRLARAWSQRAHLPFRVVWQPFRLNPDIPAGGIDRRTGAARYLHEISRIASLERALTVSGAKEGIAFAFDRIARIPNTMSAHRLMRFAARFGRQDPLADSLYSAYFEGGRDIGDCDTLIECAAAAGLEKDAAHAFLTGSDETANVAAMDLLARQGGIDGVPYFIFNRRFALAGAQEATTFLPLFDAIGLADEIAASPV
jgi:predicted DsbA family dithiol-disulfide isomerase